MKKDSVINKINDVNPHHLELFYYVARHGGFTAAARAIPYGIQQPAISSQVNKLQSELGVQLFVSKPFSLTPAGELLFGEIEGFFSRLDAIERMVRGEADDFVRIGSSAVVLRSHLPPLLSLVKKQMPLFRFALEDKPANAVPDAVLTRQIDVGIGPMLKAPKAVQCEPITTISLALLVPEDSPWQKAEEVFNSEPRPPLIALPPPDMSREAFDRELDKRRLRYAASIEVATLALVTEYVRAGFGVGLSTQVGRTLAPTGTRYLQLRGFPSLEYAVYWREPLSKAGKALIAEIRAAAKKLKIPVSVPQ